MRETIKILFTAYLFLAFCVSAKTADTLKVHYLYKFKLNDEGNALSQMVVKEQFYDRKGIFFREICFDETTGNLSGYKFLFYRDGKLFTEESYNLKDSLQNIIKYEYDANSNNTKITKLIPVNKELEIAEKAIRTYKNGKIVSEKKYAGRQVSSITKFKYNNSGLLLNEKTSDKLTPDSKIKNESKTYSYSTDSKIKSIEITGIDISGKPIREREEYEYNPEGLLSSVKLINSEGKQTGEKIYKYIKSGLLQFYEEHNASGKIILLYKYEYKKHFMERGTQVSYYENL